MSDISIEKKLELVQQVRKQYQQNQQDLLMREGILTGREHNEKPSPDIVKEEGIIFDGSTKLRFLAALILLVLVIFFDQSGQKIYGIGAETVFQWIAEEHPEPIF